MSQIQVRGSGFHSSNQKHVLCAIVSISQVGLNVEKLCQFHQSVYSSLASEQEFFSLSLSYSRYPSFLNSLRFSVSGRGFAAADGGVDLCDREEGTLL